MRNIKKYILLLIITVLSLPLASCDIGQSGVVTNIHRLSSKKSYTAYCEELFTFQATDSSFNIIQGGYFDGKTFYVACLDRQWDGSEKTKILVMDAKGKILRESDALDLDHANNITYNKKINKFVVSHCQSPYDDYCRYSFVNPETLEVSETGDKEYPFFSMAYSADKNQYASGEWDGQIIDIWDGDMNHIKSVSVEMPGSLPQGVFCDKKGIYFVRSSRNGHSSEIRIYNWDCDLVHAIPIKLDDRIEPENINIVGGFVYIVANDHNRGCGVVYTLSFENA